jgi:hypothetical protein
MLCLMMNQLCLSVQKYGVIQEYYKKGKPVFIFIGGEGPGGPDSMRDFQWVNYAKTYNAMMFMVQHRYYGESYPTRWVDSKADKGFAEEQKNTTIINLAACVTKIRVSYN